MKRANVRNSQLTKDSIKISAANLFIKKGFYGTSISDIVENSGQNKRMIYHHFGSKEALYQSIYNEKLGQFYGILNLTIPDISSLSSAIEIKDCLNKLAIEFFNMLARDNDFVRMMAWNEIEMDQTLSAGIWENITSKIFGRIKKILQLAKQKKIINNDLDPDNLLIGILGIISSYFANAKLTAHLLESDIRSANNLNKHRQLIHLIMDAAIKT